MYVVFQTEKPEFALLFRADTPSSFVRLFAVTDVKTQVFTW